VKEIGISPSNYSELKDISSLITRNKSFIDSEEDSEKKDYFTSKENALSAILPGYDLLPQVYHAVFVTPLKELFTNYFDLVASHINMNSDIPYRDWIDTIQQRKEGYLKSATNSFQVVLDDLFSGWLDSESRLRIKPPDNQTLSPLARWANPQMGPYTVAVNQLGTSHEYGIKMSVVTMGPAISRNISIWGAVAHECGHDITFADNGLLAECARLVYSQILKAPQLQGQEILYNGTKEPLATRAAEVYKFWMYEIVADVLGVLNFGPASGIAYAAFLIPLRSGKLRSWGAANEAHPIDALRIFLVADLVRQISSLNANVRNSWSDALEGIIGKYISHKDKFVLGHGQDESHFYPTVEFPFESMRETTKIVAKTLAFGELETLEKHYLAEINTWADNDEIIAVRIANDLLNKKEPSLDSQSGETKIYPAHLVAGSIYAIAESADISNITDLATLALSKLYDKNAVWGGFMPSQMSDFFIHRFAPKFL